VDDPVQTAEKFFVDRHGRRSVRTGDVGYLRPDGKLVMLGRSDLAVKVRGTLVDPNGVERALGELDGVEEAIVSAIPTPERGTRLVAHVLRVAGATCEPHVLRAQVARTLAPAAVPSSIHVMDA